MTTLDIIRKTKAAWSALRDADAETKNRLLTAMADSLVEHTAEILTCNEADLEAARGRISDVMLDRLRLDESRIAAMAEGIRATVKLPDHTGRILSETHHANGMTIYKDSQLKAFLEQAGFQNIQIHKRKNWLCVTAQK